MDERDKITIDRETFKALAADSRIEILKRLEEHKLTLTDLAEKLKMSPSTVKEHLDRLSAAGLIEQLPGDAKWKYYKLTRKGKNILNPYETRVWFVLAVSAIGLIGILIDLFGRMTVFNTSIMSRMEETLPQAGGTRMLSDAMKNVTSEPEVMLKAASEAADTATTTLATALESASHARGIIETMPTGEIALALVLTLAVGLCIGLLMKKKSML
ncbi:MAG: winged helix-turn-helix domain-containing protein [Candidatus Altiarchaeota archaeon]|nr:winged helix-turn-helix domain-containing protein [Candidatus Altiarchaeota archaeon]